MTAKRTFSIACHDRVYFLTLFVDAAEISTISDASKGDLLSIGARWAGMPLRITAPQSA